MGQPHYFSKCKVIVRLSCSSVFQGFLSRQCCYLITPCENALKFTVNGLKILSYTKYMACHVMKTCKLFVVWTDPEN